MGSSVGLTQTVFPLPCSFDDIRGVVSHLRIKSVLIVLDSDEADWEKFWEAWEEILKGTQITIVCSEERRNLVEGLASKAKEGSLCIKARKSEDGKPFSNCVSILLKDVPPQDLILSSSPYDPYGEHVKAELEKALLVFLRKWEAVFLLHDPQYRVVRVADFRILKDRIFWRPWRISIYVWLVRAVFWLGAIFIRNNHEGWIRLK